LYGKKASRRWWPAQVCDVDKLRVTVVYPYDNGRT
jgi:hypothetical protein